MTARELVERLEVRERLAAIVDELRLLDADLVDVPLTLAEVVFPWDERVIVDGRWVPHPEIQAAITSQKGRGRK